MNDDQRKMLISTVISDVFICAFLIMCDVDFIFGVALLGILTGVDLLFVVKQNLVTDSTRRMWLQRAGIALLVISATILTI